MPCHLTALTLLLADLLVPLPCALTTVCGGGGGHSELLNRLIVPLFALLGVILPARRSCNRFDCGTRAAISVVRRTSPTSLGGGSLSPLPSFGRRAATDSDGSPFLVTIAPPLMWLARVHQAQNETEMQFLILLDHAPSLLWLS